MTNFILRPSLNAVKEPQKWLSLLAWIIGAMLIVYILYTLK